MGSAIDDIHHRNGQLHDTGTAEITVKRQSCFFGCRLGDSHGNGQHGVGTQTALVFRSVQINQGTVQKRLFAGVQSDNRLGDFGIDMFDGFQYAFSVVTAGIAVTQFDRFARSCRGSGRNGGTPHDT